jgi:NAD(P)-dependent dehydrogenase (short-subunit alcohol dehydrogenase family)
MKRKGSSIINLSSISGRGITPESGVAYATAKAGLVGFTRRLAVELAPAGIRCNAVAPGYVMTERIRTNLWEPADAARRASMIDRIPVGRFAEPEEIAAIIAFLASDEASYLTGITVDCNGGIVSP